MTDLLASLSLLLALTESLHLTFYFILLCFPGFLGNFFMNGKAKFGKPVALLAHRNSID